MGSAYFNVNSSFSKIITLTWECTSSDYFISFWLKSKVMMDGILVDSGTSRKSFESIESFADFSPLNNRVLKIVNCRTIPIIGIGTVLICESPRVELPGSHMCMVYIRKVWHFCLT